MNLFSKPLYLPNHQVFDPNPNIANGSVFWGAGQMLGQCYSGKLLPHFKSGVDSRKNLQYLQEAKTANFKYKDFTVKELIVSGLPVSATLGLSSIVVSLFLGSILGIIAAIRKNTYFDYTIMGISLVGICVPSFVMAPLLSLFFGLYLGLLPTSGWNGGNILNLILPIIALSLPQIAVISRMMRASTIEVLNSNFIRTAKSKGLKSSYIVRKHVIRASILPIIEYLAPASAGLMTGSIIVEQIFGLPGIGRYFVVGALQRDYTLVSGVMILYASLLIILILITDILRAYLDPRVKI